MAASSSSSSSSGGGGPPTSTSTTTTLGEYLALPENENANLVVPLPWCPHLELLLAAAEDALKRFDEVLAPHQHQHQGRNNDDDEEVDSREGLVAACAECGDRSENWICLTCMTTHCSRFVRGHMADHGAKEGHPLVLSFSDISVWCYGCDDYVDNNLALGPFKNAVHRLKFGSDMANFRPT